MRSLLLTTPGGFDAFISQAGIRLTDGIMPLVEPPTPDQMPKLLKLAEEFGIKIIALRPSRRQRQTRRDDRVATAARESPAGGPLKYLIKKKT